MKFNEAIIFYREDCKAEEENAKNILKISIKLRVHFYDFAIFGVKEVSVANFAVHEVCYKWSVEMINMFTMVGAGFFLILSLMSVIWVVYYFRRSINIIDVGWGLGFILVVWAYLLIGDGFLPKKLIIVLMVTAWSGRLTWYLLKKSKAYGDDPRYIGIVQMFGEENAVFKMYPFFLFQGLLLLLLTIPFLVVCGASVSTWHSIELIGIIIWFIGVVGEAYSDKQLFDFKGNLENTGKVCKSGFWRYSRHPNYFFEFVLWIGYMLFALGSPWGFLAITAPVFMLLLLLRVSGVPLAEAEALRTKGEEYKKYQETTSTFIPWFPKE